MEQNLKERVEPHLLKQLKSEVEEAESRMGLSKLDIPPEVFKELRRKLVEELVLMYQKGKDDHHAFIKGVYMEDVDALIEMLEREDETD